MKEALLTACSVLIIIFAIWIVVGVLTIMGAPIWKIVVPITGLVATIIVAKIVDED